LTGGYRLVQAVELIPLLAHKETCKFLLSLPIF